MDSEFEKFEIEHISREKNNREDLLFKLANTKKPEGHKTVIQETLVRPSIEGEEIVMVIEEADREWMIPIWKHLTKDWLPENAQKARKIRRQAILYTITKGMLYKRSFSGSLLKCLTKEEGEYVMAEIHGGIFGMHNGGRVLVKKVIREGYYWRKLMANCIKWVHNCDECQKHAVVPHKAGGIA